METLEDIFNRRRDPDYEVACHQMRGFIGSSRVDGCASWLEIANWYWDFRWASNPEPYPDEDCQHWCHEYRRATVRFDLFPSKGLIVPILSYVHPLFIWEQGVTTRRYYRAFDPEPTASAAVRVIHTAWNLHLMPYADYLATDHWQHIRAQAMAGAYSRCNLCASVRGLVVHHNYYVRRGFEETEDLCVLCRSCHRKFHKLAASPQKD